MSRAGRVTTQPLRPYMRLPEQSAAPIAAGSTTNACVLYTDGTSLLLSIDGGAYVAVAEADGGTFTGPITIDTSTAPALSIDTDAVSGTIARIRHDVATTPTEKLTALLLDLTTNWLAGNVNHVCLDLRIPATTAADAAAAGAIAINSDATAQRVIDIDVANTSGTIMFLRYGSAVTFAGAITGLSLSLDPTTSAGNQAVSGLVVTLDGGATAGTDPSNASFCARLDYRSVNGTSALGSYGNGILNVDVGEARTLSSCTLTGIECDLTNVTPGANAVIGQRILIPATTRVAANGEAALVIASDATEARVIDIDAANLNGNVLVLRYGSAAVMNGAVVGLRLDLQTNVTAGAQTPQAIVINLPASTGAYSGQTAAIVIDSLATGDFKAIDIGIRNTSATAIFNINWTGATSLTGSTTLSTLDATTNVTPGAVAIIGQRILIPATTRANTAGEGALVIASDATAARAIDIDIANTSGTPFIMRYGAATEPNAVVMATLDMSTNVTTNTSANVGLDVIMLAADRMTSAPLRINGARVFVNAGIPIDANGSNGDIHIDTAGDKDAFRPTISQRQSAAWIAIA